jgi:hypothetical protein
MLPGEKPITEPDKLGHIWQKAPPGMGDVRNCRRCGLGETNQYAKLRCKITELRPKGVASEYDPLSAA